MEKSFSESYAKAGVDITAGYKAVELIKKSVERTCTAGVLGTLGGFGGNFELDLSGIKKPVLVSGTDGVGTKLQIAFLTCIHNTVGIDCVAMCVNDVICSFAKPLFFLDYIACGKNIPEKIAAIVEGVAEGCIQSGCALIGGETAEMPGFYPVDEYDIAGFTSALVCKTKMPDTAKLQCGDVVIALPSSGVHSNGFSLIRKVFGLSMDNKNASKKILQDYKTVLGKTLGEELLTPTKIYVKPVLHLLEKIDVHGIAHITGGGFYENMPRCITNNFSISIKKSDAIIPPIFNLIAEVGGINEHDMFNTFNMGVGMIAIVASGDADAAIANLKQSGIFAYKIGKLLHNQCGSSCVEII
ncbi:MAG: phosphoribosylformylglycinamidine cyclo-ligase [Termitinemataceae bacterium]|nr:MAG: phosphoribosylformylglycinamidine cyclo-ligase [Termitinemataceae bacterium]